MFLVPVCFIVTYLLTQSSEASVFTTERPIIQKPYCDIGTMNSE